MQELEKPATQTRGNTTTASPSFTEHTSTNYKALAYLFFTKYFPHLLLAYLVLVPIFSKLDALPIRTWDEARQAINAYEMHKNGNPIVTYFEGAPDMWNTKPPFLIWIQASLMKIIGVSEWSVRLPSAVAALLTCLTLLVFSVRYLKNYWFGFIAVLVLVTSQGYINFHATRTGDYDALLTLFTTLSGLFFFAFCEKKKTKYLYFFFAFTALAVLTKSIAGLLFLPGLAIYSLLQRQVLPLLKNKHFYIGVVSFISVVASYYLLREWLNPGYLAAIQANELGGRFATVNEGHSGGFWFYYDLLVTYRYSAWYLLIPCGLLIGLSVKDQRVNRLTQFSALMALTFFLIISKSETKLEWYDVPLYPYFAILVAVFITYVFEFLRDSAWVKETTKVNIVPFVFLFILLITPYREIKNKTTRPEEVGTDKEFYEIGYYLKDAIKGVHEVNGKFLLYEGYRGQNLFYLNILKDKGVQISFKDWDKLDNGDIVIAHQGHVKQYVIDHYNYQVLKEVGNVISYKIDGRKQ
ncbi:ArnT family glycosyltransferase [Sabulibacter ruber]|uniref:ArnT family glycosyltransferase n=1 Tax=Sabulibacter ruber TaxID=2811901 RepID=UPI001A971316|nr:glycosyltransferase family 39 protein [Sabulibacter ruber]